VPTTPHRHDERGVLPRALTAVLSLFAVLGLLTAPLAAPSAQFGSQDGAERQDASASAGAPATSSTVLEDFEVEDLEDDGEEDRDGERLAHIVVANIQGERKPATPIPVDAASVPFRRRAFSSRAPPA
jgi:hypothetical protein